MGLPDRIASKIESITSKKLGVTAAALFLIYQLAAESGEVSDPVTLRLVSMLLIALVVVIYVMVQGRLDSYSDEADDETTKKTEATAAP